jgi:hypothetical protein
LVYSQGIQVETPEERHAGKVADAMRQDDAIQEDDISYVLLPADGRPMQELTFRPTPGVHGDLLMNHLKPAFRGKSSQVDLSLLQKQATQTLVGSGDTAQVSTEALQKVAGEANVETFSLVRALPSNLFTGINIYLDETGMLKRLPLNKRASDYCTQCGFDPAPQLYGDVFLGRVQNKSGIKNVSFVLGPDTAPDALWLRSAVTENLEYQMEMNRITGRKDVQPAAVGDGKSKQEDGYSWTQTQDECEITIAVPKDTLSKDIKSKFFPQKIEFSCKGDKVLSIKLFESVDVDGCTWTLDKVEDDHRNLIVSMEKIEQAFWPRIED